MNIKEIVNKALGLNNLDASEALYLYKALDVSELMFIGNEIRKQLHPNNFVSWIIDRNINITNVCVSGCSFCNFHCGLNSENAYITSIEEYSKKIEELFLLNGNQILLQGGLHPKLSLEYYEELFKEFKKRFPTLRLHALGPPEIVHLARLSGNNYETVLKRLVYAGLDSLPGAGAEILVDRVRLKLSKYKCTSNEWFEVMKVSHQMNMVTSATMMYGHIETLEERIEHIIRVREVQALKPKDSIGFIAFIPWPFQGYNTKLSNTNEIKQPSTNIEYIKMIALSRILLTNVKNIQASWLTVGTPIAEVCLNGGANDLGSIMIEENVVSSAGANFSLNANGMINTIKRAGYTPILRNQQYEFLN
ncbi:MAG: CofH family radical SAM protein [Bacteroidota bacterium]